VTTSPSRRLNGHVMATDHQHTPDLERLLRTLKRRRRLIALCTICVAASAVFFSLLQQKEYSAKAALLFRDPGLDQTLFQSSNTPAVNPQRQGATNERLVSQPEVAARTAQLLHGRITAPEILDRIQVAAEGQSDVIAVTATDHDPIFAALLANAYASQFIDLRREADRGVIRQAQTLVAQRLKDLTAKDRRTLQSRADDLKILAALQTGKAELVQQANVPSSPSSPKPVRNGVLGMILGLLLGLGLAFLFERLDRRIRDPRELEDTYGLPVLGTISESRALGTVAEKGANGTMIPGPEWEAFRKLRAKLRYFSVDREIRSVLVTSAAPEEGKTTVASNLALAAAIGGQARVLLVEADLRKPSLARRYKLAPTPGLAELLTHDIFVQQAVQQLSLPSWSEGGSALDVIVAGESPPNPSELLESHKMSELLDELGTMYDLVIVDTPPVAVVADAMPIVRKVDGVIVVSVVGASTRDGAHHLRSELESLSAPTLGVVVNRVKAGATGYYGYGYGTGSEPLDLKTLETARQ
jgi:succinoglycan biosynthesis transport protein ExoP